METAVNTHRTEIVSRLRRDVQALAAGEAYRAAPPLVLETGIAALDGALADKGFRLGALHEFVGPAATGFVAALLSLLDGDMLWCARAHRTDPLYAPGLARFGLDMSAFVLAGTQRRQDALWVMEEALKSGALAAVVLEADFAFGLTESRRLQLAAQEGGTLGLLLRPNGETASAAQTRWRVSPAPGQAGDDLRWHLELTRNRGAAETDNIWEVTLNGTAHRLDLVSETRHRPAGARTAA